MMWVQSSFTKKSSKKNVTLMFSLETSEPTTIFLASGAANPWNVTKSAPKKNINKPLLLFKFGCRDLDVHAMNDLQGGGARSIFQSVWKRS